MYLEYVWGLGEDFESIYNHFFTHFEQKIDIWVSNQKIPKIVKNHILDEKWIFKISFQIVQNHDIWYGMSPSDVLNMFQAHMYHRNMFRSDFGKIDFFVDFHIFYLWVSGTKPPKTAKNRHKLRKTVETSSLSSKLPPNNFGAANSISKWKFQYFCANSRKSHFWPKWVFR